MQTSSTDAKAATEQTGDGCSPAQGRRYGRWMVAVAAAAIAVALMAGWDWLVAAGAGALLLSLAPCLIMCGLGFCAMRRKGRSGEPRPGADAGLNRTDH